MQRRVKASLTAESDGGCPCENGDLCGTEPVPKRRQRPAHIPHLRAESGKLQSGKVGVLRKLAKSPFPFHLAHHAGEVLHVPGRDVALGGKLVQSGYGLFELGGADVLSRFAKPFADFPDGRFNDGKIAGRFLRAVRPYLNSYRRRVVHGLPLVFLLRFPVSAAWADKKAVSMLRKVRIS